jgi:predicted ATP-dependent endonuclease of OLD family
MRIQFIEIQNFRKLKSIRVDFTRDTTVLVGPNNSGKTSAIAAMQHFLVDQNRFAPDDFTASNWRRINQVGINWEAQSSLPSPPAPATKDWDDLLPSMDIWLYVENDEIHHVSQLVPTLDWEGGLLGVRLRLEPKDIGELHTQYLAAIRKAKETIESVPQNGDSPQAPPLWPRNIRDFLDRRLRALFAIRAYPLDAVKHMAPKNGMAQPQPLPEGSEPIEGDPLRRLIRIDIISAHREFADVNSFKTRSDGGDAREYRDPRRLSAQLRSYYDKHLDPQDSPEPSDLDALQAIRNAQTLFDEKLKLGFSAALNELENLGYPGVANPKLTIATKIRLTDGLNHDSAIQYDLAPADGDAGAVPLRLPEDYNGLGYQNLISIAFKLMSFRDDWMQVGKAMQAGSPAAGEAFFPPPLHLVLIEEPEAHLHAQVQQVFIRQAYRLLRAHSELGTNPKLMTQLVVSTHSSHIAHECEFASLRYFRRFPPSTPGGVPIATVVNLSEVFGDPTDTQRFITRYLKATHCDLFFADAAIFVEGPAERILLPQFMRSEFPGLRQRYITVLEIGGSHAHRLRPLVEHLGITTLVITDLDAAESPAGAAVLPQRGKGYVTRNATISGWHPANEALDTLLDTKKEAKTKQYDPFFAVRVAYQHGLQVQLDNAPAVEVLPYTFEDALVFENLDVFRNLVGDGTIKRFRGAIQQSTSADELAAKLFDIVGNLKKAEFALDLLFVQQEPWPLKAPTYIRDGLEWLHQQLRQKTEEAAVNEAEAKAKAAVLVSAKV